MNQDFYNVEAIIREVLISRIDISPQEWGEWKMFCCALKVLGYDESTFVALSSGKEADSRKAWRDEKNPTKYIATEGKAKAKIIALAKGAGMDLKPFLLSQTESRGGSDRQRPTLPTARKPEAVESKQPQEPQLEPFYIPDEMLAQGEARVRETGFYKFLCRYWDKSEVEEVLKLYRVGASTKYNRKGALAVSFPMINRQGFCRDCKIMMIDPETGSSHLKKPNGEDFKLVNWALTIKGLQDRRSPVYVYFGEHLLRDAAKPVAVVESEKTAIICALIYPQFTWIATGSISNLNPEKFEPLKGYKVRIFPDRDGQSKWREKAQALANLGYSITIDQTINRLPGTPKDDLADLLIRIRQGSQEKPQDSPEPYQRGNYQPGEESLTEATAEAPGSNKRELINISLCGDTWKNGFVPLSWRIPEPEPKHGAAWQEWLITRMCWESDQRAKCEMCANAITQDGVKFRRCKNNITLEEAASQEICRGFAKSDN